MNILRIFNNHVQINHSCHFCPPNPCTRLKLAHQKYLTNSQIMRKQSIARILKKVPFGSPRGPLQIINLHCSHIIDPVCSKRTIYSPAQKLQIMMSGVNEFEFKFTLKPPYSTMHENFLC